MIDKCDFCETAFPDYGFDYDWDANLCWTCHLMQNTMMFFIRYRPRTNFEVTVEQALLSMFDAGLIEIKGK